jgi:hypothetical protein
VGIAGSVLFVLAVVAASVYWTSSALKSTDVMQQALEKARSSETTRETLGSPIEFGWYVTGAVTYQALFGDADAAVPIAGPRRSGTLFVTARRTKGVWQFVSLNLSVDGSSSTIDLR